MTDLQKAYWMTLAAGSRLLLNRRTQTARMIHPGCDPGSPVYDEALRFVEATISDDGIDLARPVLERTTVVFSDGATKTAWELRS